MPVESIVEVAAAAIPVRAVGWSPTSVGMWVLVALVLPVVTLLIKSWPALRRLAIDADNSLRADLMTLMAAERKAHVEEVASLKKDMISQYEQCAQEQLHARNVEQSLREEIAGLHRALIQLSISTGTAIELSPLARGAADRVDAIHEEQKP